MANKKVNYLTETLGFDAGIDYKKEDFAEALAQAVPDGIDVYFENVGGTVGDEVFKHFKIVSHVYQYVAQFRHIIILKPISDHVFKVRLLRSK